MMPDVALYYSNGAVEPCTLPTQASAFDFFLDNGVKVVNQSFKCDNLVEEGRIQDYHARVNGVFVSKSSGNAGAANPDDDIYDTTCRGTWNSMCVGATTSSKDMRSCNSMWRNPYWFFDPLDREEPDVMAFGGEEPVSHHECAGVSLDEVQIGGTASDLTVDGATGTSFAAPAIAALGSLLQEYCVERLRPAPTALLLRSWFRTAAFAANPVGWNYSTLQHVFAPADDDRIGRDHEDGGGFAAGDTLRKLCSTSPSDEKVIKGSSVRTGSEGQKGSVSPDAEPAFPDTPPGEMNLKTPLDQNLVPAPGMSGYRFDTLATEELAEGDRFRFTFSWNYCNTAAGTGAPAGRLVDFDVFLYNATRAEGLYASQTGDDVNEGFDVVIPEGWGGTYHVLLYWPDDTAVFCTGGEGTAWTGWIKKAAP